MARTKKYNLQHKLDYSSRNKISKINNNIINKNNKRKTIKYHKNGHKINIKINRHMKKTQKGGFLSYFKNLYQMYKFNKLVKQMNQAENKMAKTFENYKIQTKYMKVIADKTADETTNFIINYKKKSILNVIREDGNISKDNQVTIVRNIKQSTEKFKNINLTIEQIKKTLSKEIPNFKNLTNTFNTNANKFNKIVEKFTQMSKYRTQVSLKKAKYDIIDDKEKLNKKYKSDIKEYENAQVTYEKHISFNDTYIEKLNKQVQEIDDQLKLSKFYIDQLASLAKKKSESIDILNEWKELYDKIYEKINETLDVTKIFKEKTDKLEEYIESIRAASAPIFEGYEKQRNIESLNNFIKNVKLIRTFLMRVGKEMTELKDEFIKETPASMISMDYTLAEIAINLVYEKLSAYNVILGDAQTRGDNAEHLKRQQIGGSGSSKSRGKSRKTKKSNRKLTYIKDEDKFSSNQYFYTEATIEELYKQVDNYRSILLKETNLQNFKNYIQKMYNLCFILYFLEKNDLQEVYDDDKFVLNQARFDVLFEKIVKDNDKNQILFKNKEFLNKILKNIFFDENIQIPEDIKEFKDLTLKNLFIEDIDILDDSLKINVEKFRNDNNDFTDFMDSNDLAETKLYILYKYLYGEDMDNYKKIKEKQYYKEVFNVLIQTVDKIIDEGNKEIEKKETHEEKAQKQLLAPSSKPRTEPKIDVKNNLLKNIIAAVSNVRTNYPEQYTTIIDKTKLIIDLLGEILKKDGDLKKLSNNIQAVNQTLIQLKYIEPKLLTVSVEEQPTLYGKYSWILEASKDVGKEYEALSGAKEFYDELKNLSKDIIDRDDYKVSAENIKDVIIGLSKHNNTLSDKEIDALRLVVSNEINLEAFLAEFVKTFTDHTDNNACTFLRKITDMIRIDPKKKNLRDMIDKTARSYKEKGKGKEHGKICIPSSIQSYHQQEHSGTNKKNKQH